MTIQDKDQPVLLRPLLKGEHLGDLIADYTIYMCPVRKQYSIAFEDTRGRYWTDERWVEGAWIDYSLDGNFESIQLCRKGEDLSGYLTAVDHLVDGAENDGIHFVQRNPIPELSLTLARGFDYLYEVVRPNVIRAFDTEWGAGAFMISVRSARARHANQIRKKRYRNRVLTGGESCAT